jgi:hypothetical protein
VELVFCSILDEVEGKLNSAEKTCFNGANVNSIDYLGQTPIFYAMYLGWLEMVDHLIDKGANVNVILRHFIKAVNGERTFFAWDGEALLSEQYEDNLAREFVYYPGSFSPWP